MTQPNYRTHWSLLFITILSSGCASSVATTHPPTPTTTTINLAKTQISIPTPFPTSTRSPLGDQLFVSDADAGVITRIDLTTMETSVILTGLHTPDDGACNSKGLVFVGESSIGKISRFNQDGSGVTTILDPSLELSPEGISIDNHDNLLFNTGSLSAQRYPAKGAFRISGGEPGKQPERLIPPFTSHGEGIASLLTGDILAVDFAAGRVIKSAPPQFGFSGIFVSGMINPVGIAVGDDGTVFVSEGADGAIRRVYRFTPSGSSLGVFVDMAQYLDLGEALRHMAFDSSNALYVGTTSGNLFKITPSGAVSRISRARHIAGFSICKSIKAN